MESFNSGSITSSAHENHLEVEQWIDLVENSEPFLQTDREVEQVDVIIETNNALLTSQFFLDLAPNCDNESTVIESTGVNNTNGVISNNPTYQDIVVKHQKTTKLPEKVPTGTKKRRCTKGRTAVVTDDDY